MKQDLTKFVENKKKASTKTASGLPTFCWIYPDPAASKNHDSIFN